MAFTTEQKINCVTFFNQIGSITQTQRELSKTTTKLPEGSKVSKELGGVGKQSHVQILASSGPQQTRLTYLKNMQEILFGEKSMI